jgi:predicted RNase H-like HicB family nuclease
MKRNYMVVFEREAEDNWGAWVPDVQGAVGTGDSREAARESVHQGMQIMLDDLKERGLPSPEASSMSVDFTEFDPNPSTSHYEIEWVTIELSEPRPQPDKMEHRAA